MLSPRLLAPCLLLCLAAGHADVRQCICDAARPETMAARECSLCKAVDEQPGQSDYITVRDTNPNKPNRLLAMPRFHGGKPQHLGNMTPEQRAAYWTFAIAKAREVWGEEWGLAVNSLDRRTQCHMHIHIGKLMERSEPEPFTVVESTKDIGVPGDLDGIWVHPVNGKLHVHTGNPTPELLLQR
jgi:CDP-diacylglycerol pyrophosphatase